MIGSIKNKLLRRIVLVLFGSLTFIVLIIVALVDAVFFAPIHWRSKVFPTYKKEFLDIWEDFKYWWGKDDDQTPEG